MIKALIRIQADDSGNRVALVLVEKEEITSELPVIMLPPDAFSNYPALRIRENVDSMLVSMAKLIVQDYIQNSMPGESIVFEVIKI